MIGEMRLSQIASELDVPLPEVDVRFSRISTDSRHIEEGDLYVGLVGEYFDGNDFAEEAVRCGAVAAILSREIPELSVPQLVVTDTLSALAASAKLNRHKSRATVVALTGSQGKTSIKEMLGTIFGRVASTLVTKANLNNTIGVPLTLLELQEEHRFAVIEMGANAAGEIAFSVAAADPDIVLISKANAAHIEGFGSLQGVVEAKGEILDGLGANGIAILNANDPNCDQWIARAGNRRVRLFSYGGMVGSADYRCSESVLTVEGRTSFRLITPQGDVEVALQLLGGHNAENALAAAACALEAGLSLDSVREGLEMAQPVPGRLFPSIGRAGCRLLDDSYNASPDSYKAAIDVLMSSEGEKVLVAGGMRELGAMSEEAHRAVGRYAAEKGVPLLLALGPECEPLVDAFLEAGGAQAIRCEHHAELAAACEELLSEDRVFLVKGSRGTRMDKVVSDLLAVQ